jgi:hypothetical protein
MATMNPLSATLTKFKESYASISGISTDGITSQLTTASNTVDSAISGFKSAANDSVVTSIVEGATLAKEGIERVKGHVETDISTLKANAAQLMDIIKIIEDLITAGEALTGRTTETEKDADGNDVEVVKENDQATIDKYNSEIDHYNQQGENQLNAMATAINGVSFGVSGNMKVGGTLGASIGYIDNYEFNFEAYQDPTPVTPEDEDDDTVVPAGDDETPEDTTPEDTTPEDTTPEDTTPEDENAPKKLDSFAGANENDTLDMSQHKGKSNEIAIPRTMRELKDAMHAGQPIIIEEGSVLLYDYGGLGSDTYDATGGRIYLVYCNDGNYRQVDENGNFVNGTGKYIIPSRIYEAGDNSTNTGVGTPWTNDSGLAYSGEPREKSVPTADENTPTTNDIRKTKAGDSYVGVDATGSNIHNGESTIVAEPTSMIELKNAMANGQPIKLDGVDFTYDDGSCIFYYESDNAPKYLVQDTDGNYYALNEKGERIDRVKIDPNRIAEAGDDSKAKSKWRIPVPWLNETGFSNRRK